MLCPVYGHELTPLSCPPPRGSVFVRLRGQLYFRLTRGILNKGIYNPDNAQSDVTAPGIIKIFTYDDGVYVSFHSKCKVWGQRTDTVQQFKEPGQRSVPRIF